MIAPGDIPVTYVDPGRYCFYLKSNKYRDLNTEKIVSLSNKIWLPLRPGSLFWPLMPQKRKVEYINRWITRHPVERGWVVNANETAYGYWKHKEFYEIALNQALSEKYQVKNKVKYGDLKAVLYERK